MDVVQVVIHHKLGLLKQTGDIQVNLKAEEVEIMDTLIDDMRLKAFLL